MKKFNKLAVSLLLAVILSFSVAGIVGCGKKGDSSGSSSSETLADKAALQAAIAEAEKKVQTEYTSDSWATLTTALNAAKTVNSNATATQTEVDGAKTTLLNAISGLIKVELSHGIVWNVPETEFVLTDDVIRFRPDREQSDVIEILASLVTATKDGEPTSVIIDDDTIPVKNADNLYTKGEHTLKYQAMGKDDVIVEKEYTINIVSGAETDYYFFGKNSDFYATTSGNPNWNGGNGIRVAKNNFFILQGDLTALPEELVYADKLKDLDDPMAVQNKTENDITFNVNDTSGVHILMDASGKVKMMYEGVQNDYWTVGGLSKLTPSNFGATEKTLKPGDIYFVVGSTEGGNWYVDFSVNGTEKHWRDGRFVARNTVGAGNTTGGVGVGNVAKITRGNEIITTPYENQLPYLRSGGDAISLSEGGTIPSNEAFLSGISFYDDGGVWATDTPVSAENIVITNNIDINVVGEYKVTYTVKDSTDASKTFVFERKVIVKKVVSTDFISYIAKDGTVKYLEDASTCTVYNKKASGATGWISVYSAEYFNENKTDASKISTCGYGVFIIIDANGNFVKSYFNTNMIDSERPIGANISGAATDAAVYARDNETLESGSYIIFAQQNGTVKVRDFATGLRDAYKGRIGQGTIKIVDVDGLNTTPYISYTNGENTVKLALRTYAYNPASYNASTADITVLDKNYTNATFNGFGWGFYIKINAEGKIIEVYDGANAAKLYNEANPKGVQGSYGNSNILKDFDFTTLNDGEKIIIFPNDGHVAKGDNQPKPSSFANALIALLTAGDTFNSAEISLKLNAING